MYENLFRMKEFPLKYLDDEILGRISRTSQAFGHLHTRVWHERGLSTKTKLAVYKAVVLPSLLYGYETWTCFRQHTKKLDQFYLRCPRKILRVRWRIQIPNQEILCRAELIGIEAMPNLAQLSWFGHVSRMKEYRLAKQFFCTELSTDQCHVGGQGKWYNDMLKATLKAYNIFVDKWQALAQDRSAWRKASRKGTQQFEEGRLQNLDKILARKNTDLHIHLRACANMDTDKVILDSERILLSVFTTFVTLPAFTTFVTLPAFTVPTMYKVTNRSRRFLIVVISSPVPLRLLVRKVKIINRDDGFIRMIRFQYYLSHDPPFVGIDQSTLRSNCPCNGLN